MIDSAQSGSPPYFVRRDVLDAVTTWLCDGVTCAAPPSQGQPAGQLATNVRTLATQALASHALAALCGAAVAWAVAALASQRSRETRQCAELRKAGAMEGKKAPSH